MSLTASRRFLIFFRTEKRGEQGRSVDMGESFPCFFDNFFVRTRQGKTKRRGLAMRPERLIFMFAKKRQRTGQGKMKKEIEEGKLTDDHSLLSCPHATRVAFHESSKGGWLFRPPKNPADASGQSPTKLSKVFPDSSDLSRIGRKSTGEVFFPEPGVDVIRKCSSLQAREIWRDFSMRFCYPPRSESGSVGSRDGFLSFVESRRYRVGRGRSFRKISDEITAWKTGPGRPKMPAESIFVESASSQKSGGTPFLTGW